MTASNGTAPLGPTSEVSKTSQSEGYANGTAPWWLRVLFVVAGLAAWFWTQSLIGSRTFPDGPMIGDQVHDILAKPNQYLHENPGAANALLICSSAVIDSMGVFLLAVSIFGRTVRPFLGLLLLFGMRQICQMLCALPPPTGIIWRNPGVPALLVTYDVATDFFFSGHTGLSVLGAVELARLGDRRWFYVGVVIVVFESFSVLVLRAHYTMDVFTGIIAALYATILAAGWAPWCDRTLARLGGGSS
jgi:hypothetical protein